MKELICIVCPQGCRLTVDEKGKVRGNACPRGLAYAVREAANPTRALSSTVRLVGSILPRLPVKTSREIPKGRMFDVMRALDGVTVRAPVRRGDVVLPDVCGTGADIVATRDIPARL